MKPERVITKRSTALLRVMAPGHRNDEPTAVERLTLWRKNVPALCDLCVESTDDLLEWSSLTVDWVHGASGPVSEEGLGSWCNHWLLLGTAAGGLEQDKLLLYSVILPSSSMSEGIHASASAGGAPAWPRGHTCFRLAAALPHTGDVTRARSMPQRGSIVATKCSSAPNPGVYVYDVAPHMQPRSHHKQQRAPAAEGSGPMLSCITPAPPAETGLCWSPAHEGLLLTTCEKGQLATFQLDAGASGPSLAASATFKGHSGELVNDAAFAGPWRPELFGSVAEDGTAALWDRRAGAGGGGAPVQQWQAHSVGQTASAANCVAFSALREQEVATGGSEGKVKLWDLRGGSGGGGDAAGPSTSATGGARPPLLKVLPSHRSKVTQVAWSPHVASWLMSCDARGLVYVWDLDAGAGDGSGQGQDKVESLLPLRPELRMIYGGHGVEVNDLAWCPDGVRGAGLVASVSSRMDAEDAEQQQPRQGEAEAEGEAEVPPHQFHSVQIWRPCADIL